MTENKIEDILTAEDELLIQSFFDSHQEQLLDDGFSSKVLENLPVFANKRLERWWTVFCVLLGIVFLVVSQFWNNLFDSLFSLKVGSMVMLSHIVGHLGETLSQSHNWLMMLAGVAVLMVVGAYNVIQDANYR